MDDAWLATFGASPHLPKQKPQQKRRSSLLEQPVRPFFWTLYAISDRLVGRAED